MNIQTSSPDHWALYGTRSLLGRALAGQKKFAEAEPLLLEGYQGMKQRENRIIPASEKVLLVGALEGLIQLYQDWGKPEEAEKWRQEQEIGSQTNHQNDAEGAAHD